MSKEYPFNYELENYGKTLICFDLDGSIYHGPISIKTIALALINGIKELNPDYQFLSQTKQAKHELVFNKIAQICHNFRPVYSEVFPVLETLSQNPNTDLAVLTGRLSDVLTEQTLQALYNDDLLGFFEKDNDYQVFPKPGNLSSSQWKLLNIVEGINSGYQQVYLFENNPVTAIQIGLYAQKNDLPIHVLLHKKPEAHPKLLQKLYPNYQALPITLCSIPEIPQNIFN